MVRKAPEEVTWAEHPLFPANEGDEPPHVAFIQVIRHEASGPVLVPRTFVASELTSEAQIGELYGGGLYELIGRRTSKYDAANMGTISIKRRVRLPGAPNPLAPEAPGPAPAAPVPAPPPPNGMGGMSENIIVAMMQMQAAQSQAQAQAQAASQQQFAQLMVTLITSSKSDQQGMMQAMMAMSTQQTQSMATMMTALLSSRGGGPDELAKYAQLFQTLTGKPVAGDEAPEVSADSIGKLLEDGADLVHGLVELKKSATAAPALDPNGQPK